jgi:uroporphyrin-III C-methyltransferase
MSTGYVALVGAGPGDPELITVRGLRLLESADVVVHDRLVSPELVARAQPGAEIIYAGKSSGEHHLSQDEINHVLVERASRGRFVVRLKGGDPFVFGRGGEEALALVEAGIPFEIVPGVSSAIAAPSALGIPVSHRSVASTFAVATAHDAADGAGPDWSALARIDTVVLLMGVERLESAAAALVAAGKPGSTPAAVIQDATLPTQHAVIAPLWRIASAARRAEVRAPATTIIGDVVALSETLTNLRTGAMSIAAEL